MYTAVAISGNHTPSAAAPPPPCPTSLCPPPLAWAFEEDRAGTRNSHAPTDPPPTHTPPWKATPHPPSLGHLPAGMMSWVGPSQTTPGDCECMAMPPGPLFGLRPSPTGDSCTHEGIFWLGASRVSDLLQVRGDLSETQSSTSGPGCEHRDI